LNLFGLTLKQTIATYRSGESLGMTSLASWEVPMPEIPTAEPPAPTSERSGRRVRNMWILMTGRKISWAAGQIGSSR
jgi:hypothetical protein